MHIVSYRGPGMAGGVSTALARAWDANLASSSAWWHLAGNKLQVSMSAHAEPDVVATLSDELVRGHYRFCNDFLWPVMHDLSEHATYVSEDYAAYKTFNETLGWCIVRSSGSNPVRSYFVQDYQLAFLPPFMRSAALRTAVFWHIPWPSNIAAAAVPVIKELVASLLNAEAIGFHTQEYAHNFLSFVREHLPEYSVSANQLVIWKSDHLARIDNGLWAAPDRAWALRTASRATKQITRLLVAPLGIDFDYWQGLAARQKNALWHPALMRTPFVLSVDRADYTKGVTDRIKAIDVFFEQHPEWRERITFAQVCGKTRDGLKAFESYWNDCRESGLHLREKWATASWQPLVWLETSFSSADLAHAYRTATAMLIPAVRDGLNLTAKEYVACQSAKPGVLALSSGTGAWHELGAYSVTLRPGDVGQIAEGIHQSIAMDAHERAWRMAMLQDSVRRNTLSAWWQRFADVMAEPTRVQNAQIR